MNNDTPQEIDDNTAEKLSTFEADAKPEGKRKQRRSGVRVALQLCFVLMVLVVGGAAGWWARGESLDEEPVTEALVAGADALEEDLLSRELEASDQEQPAAPLSEESPLDQPTSNEVVSEVSPLLIPNVLDLTAEQARTALVEAGVDPDSIRIGSVAAAGEAGLLIDQDPSPGEVLGDSVILYVSEQVATPDLVGSTEQHAIKTLDAFGALTTVDTRYVHGAEAGLIVETVPAAGELLSQEVTVILAEEPSSVFLSQLITFDSYPWAKREKSASGFDSPGGYRWDSGCYYGKIQISGTEYNNSQICVPFADDVAFQEYVFNREVSLLVGTLGLDDFTDNSQALTFTIYIDDQDPISWTVSYGEAVPFEIDLSGALRIRLQFTRTTHNGQTVGLTAGWGDARLIGSKAAIDDIIKNSGIIINNS